MSGKRRIVGLHAAQSALEHTPDKLTAAWVDAGRMDVRLARVKQELEAAGVNIHIVNRKELERLSEGRNHQGVIVELEMAHELGETDLRDALDALAGQAFFLVLDHVQDPHNLGACLRSADAAGVDGVIITKDQSVGITPRRQSRFRRGGNRAPLQSHQPRPCLGLAERCRHLDCRRGGRGGKDSLPD